MTSTAAFVRSAFVCAAVLLATSVAPASAAGITVQGLSVGGTRAALLLPARPKGAIILLAGGDGSLGIGADGSIARPGNQVVRTREAYAARGFAVLVPDGDGGITEGAACRARAHHGFNGIDGQVVSAAAGFAAR